MSPQCPSCGRFMEKRKLISNAVKIGGRIVVSVIRNDFDYHCPECGFEI